MKDIKDMKLNFIGKGEILKPNENGIYRIEHLGKVLETTKYDDTVTDDVLNDIVQNFYPVYSLREVQKNFKNLYNGKTGDTEIYYYYFFKLACECGAFDSKWTIEEFLTNLHLLRHAFWYMNSNEKIYPKSLGYSDALRTKFFSMTSRGLARKPSNFPFNVCKEFLETYKEKILLYRSQNFQEMKQLHPSYFDGGFNYFDPSSGWGGAD